MRETIERTFVEQVGPVIEQQRNIGERDLYEERPALLPTDKAAGYRNRIVRRMIAAEADRA